jgi:hypothetical protein
VHRPIIVFQSLGRLRRYICSEIKPTELIYHLNVIHAMILRLKWILGANVTAFQSFISRLNETVVA